MKRRFEHNLFFRIALRFVEARGRFWFAKDVGDAVIADAVAGTEVGMGIVVECTPSDSAGILRIGCELIVDAGMAQRVFALPLVIIGGLGGESVADEFGVEIARMIRRLAAGSRNRS